MKNILLIGLPGSGKSFFGKGLAEAAGMDFVDLDLAIVEREGCSIDEIFKNRGEEGFRKAETEALKTLAGRLSQTQQKLEKAKGMVIATGGGIVLREENRLLLDEIGVTVFLDRNPKNILSDVNLDDRPLLKGNPKKLEELHRARLGFYQACADFLVDGNLSQEKVSQLLLKVANLEKKKLNLAVIGDPVDHSLSPIIHKSILSKFIEKIEYERIRIEKGGLEAGGLEKIRTLDGFNVTMPHKTDIIMFVDKVEPKALEMQSVNTVVLNDGVTYGYSTDGAGIRMALEKLGKNFENAHVMIFGSGGAGTAAAGEAVAGKAAKLEIFSRRGGGENFSSYSELGARSRRGGHEKTSPGKAGSGGAMILINASPMGMAGMEDLPEGLADYSFLDGLKENGAVLDMVYHPAKTRLLLEAEKRGIPACNGLFMLIGQAIEADNIFLGMGEGMKLGIQKAYERALEGINKLTA